MDRSKTLIETLMALTSLCLLIPSVKAEEASFVPTGPEQHQVLGFIQLDKTPFRDVVNKIVQRKCQASIDGNGVEIKPGCFALPGDPIVLIQNSWSALRPDQAKENDQFNLKNIPLFMGDAPVVRVVISMDKPNSNYWNEYLESMTRVWGQPDIPEAEENADKSFSTAFWKKDGVEIVMQGFDDGIFQIIYSGPQWSEAEKDMEQAISNRRKRDLDALL